MTSMQSVWFSTSVGLSAGQTNGPAAIFVWSVMVWRSLSTLNTKVNISESSYDDDSPSILPLVAGSAEILASLETSCHECGITALNFDGVYL